MPPCLVVNVLMHLKGAVVECLGAGQTLSQCQLTQRGLPIMSVSDGKSYTYDSDMCCW